MQNAAAVLTINGPRRQATTAGNPAAVLPTWQLGRLPTKIVQVAGSYELLLENHRGQVTCPVCLCREYTYIHGSRRSWRAYRPVPLPGTHQARLRGGVYRNREPLLMLAKTKSHHGDLCSDIQVSSVAKMNHRQDAYGNC